MRSSPLMDEERQTNEWPAGLTGRGLRGRRLARFMFVPAIVPAAFVAFLLFASPNYMYEQPSPLDSLIAWLAILMYVVGLAALIRIYRADPEAHKSFWRSRRY
jgi:hypothetical protein